MRLSGKSNLQEKPLSKPNTLNKLYKLNQHNKLLWRFPASWPPSFPAFLTNPINTINSVNFYPVKYFVEIERSEFNRGIQR